jgi:exopolysaccharide biosynthesis predicted pyruvyltransferase EpsI
MSALRDRLDAVARSIGASPVVLLDVPIHFNLGDLLIHRGTEWLLARHRVEIRLRQSSRDFDVARIQRALGTDDGVILLHGGGNFGDLYPHHQALREQVVEAFPEHRVVQLPQTAHFRDDELRRRSAAIFRRHARVTMLARDARTAAVFGDFSNAVERAPDLAHALYPLAPAAPQHGHGELALWRRDAERKPCSGIDEPPGVDWEDLVDAGLRRRRRWVRSLLRADGWRSRLAYRLWSSVERELIRRAQRLYLAHDRIATSRLHGHLLACLLDLPSRVYDNSYGKVGGYAAEWTLGSPLSELADAEARPSS